jgi:hypothetical protein
MRRYSSEDEETIRTLNILRDWGLHTADLQPDLKRTNFFFRLILFVFTAMLVSASMWLIVFVFEINEKNPTIALSIGAAIVCFTAADLLVGRYRLYRFGVEEALAMASVVLVSGGTAALAPNEFRDQALVGLGVGAVSSLFVYIRFGYVYAAVASMLCTALIPFTFDRRFDLERLVAALILMCVFVFVRRKRLLWGEDFPGDDYGILQAASWVGIYIALNFQFGAPDRVHDAVYWFTYLMIWLLPIAGLWFALEKKDRPLMQASIAMALVTLATNKLYLGLMQKPWDPILFGILLMSVAIVVKRWLANGPNGQRYGFTSARLLSGDKKIMTAIATASSLLQPNVPPGRPTPSSPQPEFGGGRSGGGGATGEF